MFCIGKKNNLLCVNRYTCNQKERVRNHTAHWLCARPQASMPSRSSSSQFRPLIIPQHIDYLLTLTYTHCKTRDVFSLLPHNDRTEFTRCISCPARSHNFQSKKIFSFQIIYIARKHKLDFHQMLRKTPTFQCCLLFLSLSFSRILLQQSLGHVLGAAECSNLAPSSLATNRTSPDTVLLPSTPFHYLLPCSDLSKKLSS